MHEMSLCENIREVLEEQAVVHGLSRITHVRLEIGRLSCVEQAALEFAFEAVMRRSVSEGATLEIIDVPGRALCLDCGRDVEIEDRLSPCPNCQGSMLVHRGGDEMRIKDLEGI